MAAASSASAIAWTTAAVNSRRRTRKRTAIRKFSIALRTWREVAAPRPVGAVEAGEDGVDLRLVFGEKGFAVRRERIELAPALLLGGSRVAHVLDHRQGRIDDAGAGAVAAANSFAERLDDLVAVARFLGHMARMTILKIAEIERAAVARLEARRANGGQSARSRPKPPWAQRPRSSGGRPVRAHRGENV